MRFRRCISLPVACLTLTATVHAGQTPLHGLRVEPPKPVPVRQLVDHNGLPVSFPAGDGRWKLVFFGYTSCPDVCPTTMHRIVQILGRLGEEKKRLRAVFISIDGQRDKPEVLKSFVRYFHADITGLTGDPREVVALENLFGVTTRKIRGETAFAYTLAHSVFMYLLDPSGRLRYMYPASATPAAIAEDLTRLLAGDTVSRPATVRMNRSAAASATGSDPASTHGVSEKNRFRRATSAIAHRRNAAAPSGARVRRANPPLRPAAT